MTGETENNKRIIKQVDKQQIPFNKPVTAWKLGVNVLEVVSMAVKSDSLS